MKKKTRLQIAQDNAQAAIDETNEKIGMLGENTSKIYNALTEIQSLFDKIRNVPDDKKLEYEKLKEIRLNWKQQAEKIEKDYETATAKDVGVGAAGAGVGVAVAALGPTAAMGVATTFGVASTGTAIASLSGAAATNAALAWLGGGALAAGGGGMVAGEAFLALAGPVGWAIAGVSLLASAMLIFKSKNDKEKIENLFTLISQRDVKSYNLAIVELNERISRIIDETEKLQDAITEIQTFGTDYSKMTEAQQYTLGAYVNLMSSSTQLLVNPILGLIPKFADEDFDKYSKQISNSAFSKYDDEKYRTPIITLANLLYKIKCDDNDVKLLSKSLKHNKKFLENLKLEKADVESCINLAIVLIKFKLESERKNWKPEDCVVNNDTEPQDEPRMNVVDLYWMSKRKRK